MYNYTKSGEGNDDSSSEDVEFTKEPTEKVQDLRRGYGPLFIALGSLMHPSSDFGTWHEECNGVQWGRLQPRMLLEVIFDLGARSGKNKKGMIKSIMLTCDERKAARLAVGNNAEKR